MNGSRSLESRFMHWVEVVSGLPRKQTRVLTWPLVTVFGFIAQPDTHMFLKPLVTREAARVRRDQRRLKPRDMIDLQSFIWVQGSDEYR